MVEFSLTSFLEIFNFIGYRNNTTTAVKLYNERLYKLSVLIIKLIRNREIKKGITLDVADPQKQKQLPQVNMILTACPNVEKIGEEQRFVHTIRPRYFIGSSESVWASDLLKIKWEFPQLRKA